MKRSTGLILLGLGLLVGWLFYSYKPEHVVSSEVESSLVKAKETSIFSVDANSISSKTPGHTVAVKRSARQDESALKAVIVPNRFAPIDEKCILEQRVTTVFEDCKKRELLVKTDGKYAFHRIEETLQRNEGEETYTVSSRIEMVADQVVVKLALGATEGDLSALVTQYGISISRKLTLPGYYVLQLKSPRMDAVTEALLVFAQVSDVIERVEPNHLYSICRTPNDSQWSSLWGMRKTQATNAWEITTGADDVLVAVIDTGIDVSHADLTGNMWTNPGETGPDGSGNDKETNGEDDDGNGYIDDWRGWDFANSDNDPSDDNKHGTHVAGTIGAVGNNSVGVAGVCWNVSLVGVKFLGADGSGSSADAVDAILYASRLGAKIQNHSWGGYGDDQTVKDAISAVNSNGVLFVAAAGNFNNDNDSNPFYPASYDLPNIVSVAATDEDDQLASFSHYGATSVDLAAPGVDILSTVPGNDYDSLQGTSMAAPHVSGAAALLLSANSGLTHLDIKDALINSADKIPSLTGKTVSGGRLNAYALMSAAADEDGDGMPDDWEDQYNLNKNSALDADLDPDGDFLTNLQEYRNGTHPLDSDSDNDSLVDGWEVAYGFSPLSITGQLSSVVRTGISTGDEAVDVFVTNGYAYVADGESGLTIIDVSNPSTPSRKGSVNTAGFAGGVAVNGSYAYVADGTNGLVVVNVANPAAPLIAGSYDTTGTAVRVAVQGGYVYVADGVGGMRVINVSNPSLPAAAGRVIVSQSSVNDVYVDGTNAYLTTDNNSILRYNISNPSSPSWVNNGTGVGVYQKDVPAVHGNGAHIFAAAAEGVIRIFTSALSPVSTYACADSPLDVFATESYLYIAEGEGGLEIVDITNITNPVQLASYPTFGGGKAVFAAGNHIYLADGTSGMQIFFFAFDADSDGMLDSWELENFGGLSESPTSDFDGDGIINWGEYLAGLNPKNPDQDADSLSDGNDEVRIYNTDPRTPDTDTDGLSDGNEINGTSGYVTDPLNPDTDGDGLPDGWEVNKGFNPVADDSAGDADTDGLSNIREYNAGTDPLDSDTDNDSMPDGWEVDNGLTPLVDDAVLDPDADGLTNLQEYGLGTDPKDRDTDNDGMSDGWEVTYMPPLGPTNGADGALDGDGDGLNNLGEYLNNCNPTSSDTDADGMPDGWEVNNGLIPTSTNGVHGASGDPDSDGLKNIQEYGLTTSNLWLSVYTSVTGAPPSFWFSTNGVPGSTDPKDADSDDDGLTDYYEITTNVAVTNLFITNPNSADTDGDGLPDKWELDHSSDPTIPALAIDDSDGDGLSNGDEDALGTDPANSRDPVFVDDNGPNDQAWGDPTWFGSNVENGTFSNAFDSIQEAIDANTTVNGMTILVNDGEYVGEGNFNINPRGKAITIRSWNGRDVTLINTLGIGAGFVVNSGEGTNTVIKGFGITTTINCCSDGDCDKEDAVLITASSPQIDDCKIYECELSAIVCSQGAAPVIRGCEIYSVRDGIQAEGSSPHIISNLIHSVNVGVYVDGGSGASIYSTVVSNCFGRGIVIKNNDSANIIGSIVERCNGGITLDNSDASIMQCVIRDNEAGTYYTLAGLTYITWGLFDLNDSNAEDVTDSDENGGGILLLNSSSPMIVNTLITGNKTWAEDPEYSGSKLAPEYGLGAGIYVGEGCSPTGVNCTVADNWANTRGGGLSSLGNPILRNMIFWGNTSSNSAIILGARTNSSSYAYPNLHCRSGSINIWYSDIQYGYSTAWLSTTNNPLFVGSGTNKYHLSSTNSSCYNKGTYYLAPVIDLIGFARPTAYPDRVDMGCYEFGSTNQVVVPVSGITSTGGAVPDPQADTDGDGFKNGDEIVAGTDIYDETDYFKVVHDQSLINGLILISWQSAPESLYTVQTSTNLLGVWSSVPGFVDVPGTGFTMNFTGSMTGYARYYRVQVRLP